MRHAVLHCAGTEAAWRRVTGRGSPEKPWANPEEELWKEMFRVVPEAEHMRERIQIVGECFIDVQKGSGG